MKAEPMTTLVIGSLSWLLNYKPGYEVCYVELVHLLTSVRLHSPPVAG